MQRRLSLSKSDVDVIEMIAAAGGHYPVPKSQRGWMKALEHRGIVRMVYGKGAAAYSAWATVSYRAHLAFRDMQEKKAARAAKQAAAAGGQP